MPPRKQAARPARGLADDRIRCLLRLDHPAGLQQGQDREIDTGVLRTLFGQQGAISQGADGESRGMGGRRLGE